MTEKSKKLHAFCWRFQITLQTFWNSNIFTYIHIFHSILFLNSWPLSIGLRLQELEQQAYNERMLAAACAGDLVAVEESLRFSKGDCNSQQTPFCIQSFHKGSEHDALMKTRAAPCSDELLVRLS